MALGVVLMFLETFETLPSVIWSSIHGYVNVGVGGWFLCPNMVDNTNPAYLLFIPIKMLLLLPDMEHRLFPQKSPSGWLVLSLHSEF